jgi:uncharacterized membrane protein
MDAKRTVAALIIGAAVLYGVGWLLFDKLLLSFYQANAGSATGVMRESQVMWSMVVGYLFYAYAIIFALRFRPGAGSMGQGFLIGAAVGFLIWGTVDFIFYGIANINNLTVTIVDPLVEIVHGGIAGAVIAAVRGGGSATSAA